jgi:AraC family transcriptional regulator of adaptative response/methylated-DNA-[protein]-cysteine methyltransferase
MPHIEKCGTPNRINKKLICTTYIETPLGKMIAGATDEGICLFDFEYRQSLANIMKRVETALGESFSEREHPYFKILKDQVDEYFDGCRKRFSVPLQLFGTPFQINVWQGLQQIEYGETRSYKKQSIILGNEKAIRAVARANGENGIAIIIPCHRVIGETGHLVGYGGGLSRKKWLLEHEMKHSDKQVQLPLFA